MALIVLSCAWVAGILLGARFNLAWNLVFLVLMPLPLIFILRQHKKAIVLTSLCLLLIFLGALRFASSLPERSENYLRLYNDRAVAIKGTVSADPDISNKTARLRLAVSEIKLDNGWQAVTGDVLVFAPSYVSYRYGDFLQVRGRLQTPPVLGDFDYAGYLAHEGIYSTMSFPEISLIDRGRGNGALAWLYSLRKSLSETFSRILPEPQASLAQGMILGIRGNIPSSLNTDMSRTGTTHILAISGMNISIIAGILLSLGIWFFGRRHYIYVWLALGIIWLYALLTGMNPPVLRATIMASLFFIAELLGRQKGALTSLAFAVAVMVGVNPQILWNASFQMSATAMLGLVIITPTLQSKGRELVQVTLGERPFTGAAAFITDGFSVSLGAIIAVTPIIAYYFGIFAFISPLATLFILPVLAGIIVTGALAGLAGLIFLPLSQAIAWLTWLFLSYMLLVIEGFGRMPSFIQLETGNSTLVWTYYLVLSVLILVIINHKKIANPAAPLLARISLVADKASAYALRRVKRVILPLFILAVMTTITVAAMPDNNLHVSFLDVGEGDATLIQTSAGQNILIDGGPDRQKLSLALGEKLPFWDREIDLVILTHPHQDHLYGLVDVLQKYKVKEIFSSGIVIDSPLQEEWLRLVREKGIKYTEARGGELLSLGGATMRALDRPTFMTKADSDIDNNSLVLRLDAGNISFLFTADIMQEAEWALISRRAEVAATVLKVAHHGSDTSTTPEFLSVVNPRVAVISVGAGNQYGHPSLKIVARLNERPGATVYRTDQQGTLELITDGVKLWVKTGNGLK